MLEVIIETIKNTNMFEELINTILMVGISTLISYLIGIPIGVLVMVTDQNGLVSNKFVHKVTDIIVNLARSIPFIILLVAIIPFTKAIMGTSIGVRGMIVPLSIGAIPFVARLIESSLKEIPASLIEAGKCMGCSSLQIIFKIYLVESLPSIIRGIAITFIMLIGYSAMSGAVGGGGLGNIAIQYGYYRFDSTTMFVVLIVLIIFIQIVQWIFNIIAKKIDKSIKE